MAAVEAFVNELLAVQHPDEYDEWEIRRRQGFWTKLKGLIELHGLDPEDLNWFHELDEHAKLRNSMLHHRPSWVLDDRDEDSIAPEDDMTQERLSQTLVAVERAIAGLLDLYGVEPPETHQPDWLDRVTDGN